MVRSTALRLAWTSVTSRSAPPPVFVCVLAPALKQPEIAARATSAEPPRLAPRKFRCLTRCHPL
jgi:hypothetical protein